LSGGAGGRRSVLILAGATCAGKTALALELAERFDAEIVGADSRQIYRGMPIGTAAPQAAELARVAHHLVGFLDPHERYSAARYAADALAAIAGIHARGKRALVVGGTGFYVRALAGDVALSGAYDDALRSRLAHEAHVHPPEVLHAWLAVRDPARARDIPAGDRYRVARALEVALAPRAGAVGAMPLPTAGTGPPPLRATGAGPSSLRAAALPYLKVVLDVPVAELDARIETRTDAMLAAGLLAEAERIGPTAVAADAVGYPQAFAYLAGWTSRAELRALLARATRRYARRQLTWFRSEPDVRFAAPGEVEDLARRILGW
jgi:tRNA dimethylallyltransferase